MIPTTGRDQYVHAADRCNTTPLVHLRHSKYLNNIVERDHRRVKRLIRPGLGFGSMRTVQRTLARFEAIAMIRKGQALQICGRDMRAQASTIAGVFGIAT